MNYTAQDLVALVLATGLFYLLTVVPGALFARALDRRCPGPYPTQWKDWSPILGLVLLPVLDALAIRAVGVDIALLAHLALVAAALIWARDYLWRPTRIALAFAGLWWLYCAAFYVDLDIGGRLYQSLPILDLVKHAAVIREIADHGLPMHDPFFLRESYAGYYHYFYDGPALARNLALRAVDPRMAFVAAALWCGALFPQFLFNLVRELGWQRTTDNRLYLLCCAASAIGGLDLLGLLFRWIATGEIEPSAEWWDDAICFLPSSAIWVPHHLLAVIAAFMGFVLLYRAVKPDPASQHVLARYALAIVAGAAFAASFGLSTWIAIVAAMVGAASLRITERESLMPWIRLLLCSGVCAALLSAPLIMEILAGREESGGFPISLQLREPARIFGMLQGAVSLPGLLLLIFVATPVVWILEFGVFALGSWKFHRDKEYSMHEPLARMLTLAFVVGLFVNFFLRSNLLNNDLGWRGVWFAAIPAMIWTVTALQKPLLHRSSRIIFGLSIVLGLSASAYDLAAGRLIGSEEIEMSRPYINASPSAAHSLRTAYSWANDNLPDTSVLQHNPSSAPRVFDFGLYSRHRVGVADAEARLFGADPDQVKRRIALLDRVFSGTLPPADASTHGISHLVVTKSDRLWQNVGNGCVYRNANVCILPVPNRRKNDDNRS